MSEIRLSDKNDVGRLKYIWKQCFGDSDAFIDFYFQEFYQPHQTMILQAGDEIAAMLTMIPVTIHLQPSTAVPCVMLYAIATDPAYQGKGLARELIDYSNDYAAKTGKDFSVLVPASGSLFSFYEKLAYQAAFPIFESVHSFQNAPGGSSASSADRCMLCAVSAKAYGEIRDSLSTSSSYIRYELNSLVYQKKLSQLSGADLYRIEYDNHIGCAAIERLSEQKLFIKELLMPSANLSTVLASIGSLLPAEEAFIRSPLFLPAPHGASLRNFAMIKPLGPTPLSAEVLSRIQKNETYLGLAFD